MSSSTTKNNIVQRDANGPLSSTYIVRSNQEEELLKLFMGHPVTNSVLFGDISPRINSLVWFPFDIPIIEGQGSGYLGVIESTFFDIAIYTKTDVLVFDTKPNGFYMGSFDCRNRFIDFTDYEPYTTVEAYLPFYGKIDLPIVEIAGKFVNFRLYIDYKTGQATYSIGVSDTIVETESELSPYIGGKDETTIRIISTHTFQLGYELPVGKGNFNEIIRNTINSTVKIGTAIAGTMLASNFATTPIMEATSARSGEYVNMYPPEFKARSVIPPHNDIRYSVNESAYSKTRVMDEGNRIIRHGISDCMNGVQSAMAAFSNRPGIDQPNSPMLCDFGPRSIIITIKKSRVVNRTNYAHFFGRPLGIVEKCSNLIGFTKFTSFHMTDEEIQTTDTYNEIGILNSTEYNMLVDLMLSGVYL